MRKIYISLFTLLLSLSAAGLYAQETGKVIGKVVSTLNLPIKDAVVSIEGVDATTDENGAFEIACKNPKEAYLSVWASGYFSILRNPVDGRSEINLIMIPESQYRYNETSVLPFRIEKNAEGTSAENITKKDFLLGSRRIDQALSGQIAGLQVTRSSGMPGEGSYMNLRGIRSFVGNNAPLVVINGIPYMPNSNDSQLITGLSNDLFSAYNINDIQNITVLKGAEAAMYGSMGANGVILIETDEAISDNLNTEISYYGQFGINWNNKRMPLLSGTEYKTYLSDIGLGYYATMDEFFANFPFMKGDLNSMYAPYYTDNTNWQKEIYQKGFVTENLFRVEGGDAIAKYDLSLGYAMENGILKNTSSNRYHTQLNGNIMVSKNFEIYATVGLAYQTGDYQEQGMVARSNPLLAAYAQSPLLTPFQRVHNENNELVSTPVYSDYYYGICQDMNFAVSNPLAIVNEVDATNRQYDINIKAGFNYKITSDLSVDGIFGLYYHYNKEHLFIPGRTDFTIIPVTDFYGKEENSVKEGVAETMNYFYNLNAKYNHRFNSRHALNAMAGFQALVTENEYDATSSRNTTNDFFQTMNMTTGTNVNGYIDKWNWMNFYALAGYTYKNYWNATLNMSVDGSSATGRYTDRFRVYPGGGVTWMAKNMPFLADKEWINRLDICAEYSMTGNSRFSSNYGRSYYTSTSYQEASGIFRDQIPNEHLKPEVTSRMNLSMDAAFLRNRIRVGIDYYTGRTKDVIMNIPKSAVYGTAAYYANCGTIDNNGIELSAQASLIRTHDFEWIVGGNIAWNKSEIKSLGGNDQNVTEYSDGAKLVSRIGGAPYEFYGLQAAGVFSTQAEADEANLLNSSSQRFNAGDVKYVDQNGDGRIDYKDNVSLGSASPDYFGGFYTNIRLGHFALSADFTYSKGNMAYNAVRRELESVSSFGNQSEAVATRWSLEGQVTDIPHATYGDPMGNSDFSSRWIEDASYLRMKNITLSYSFDKPVFHFFRSGTLYITGENLLTSTKYLGMDPEFAYSSNSSATQGFDYAKVMQPKSVKFGINLKF